MTSNFKKFFIFVFAFLVVFGPYVVLAAGLVPCDKDCTFKQIGELVKNVISFITLKLVVPLATASIAYAGILYVTAAGNTGQTGKAREILEYAVIGIILALAAQLIVTTIIDELGGKKDLIKTAYLFK